MMEQRLPDKYNVAVPRYTSYPPANFFTENFTQRQYLDLIAKSNEMQPEHISFYIHIPFCYKMCHYCGCNALLLDNKKAVSDYIKALKKEIGLILPLLDKNRKVAQIHYGGGSPTSVAVEVLKEFNDILSADFETIDKPEIAIECHPGYLSEKYWIELADSGFNRVSIGIQDFDDSVLKIVNRKPARIPIEEITTLLKSKGVSVNMDFIYGLPTQTPESFARSIKRAVNMRPDRLVTFSYAHVPWVNPKQKELEKTGLPDSLTKNKIYESARDILTTSGYKMIGLDHFVLPEDELFVAQQNKILHRNFQGYCTRRTTGQVYAFGMTGISQLATAYSQNVKDLKSYIEILDNGNLPVFKGYILNEQEQITKEVINTLMCNYEISWNNLANYLNLSVEQIKGAVNYDENVLNGFMEDGLIIFDSEHITMLPEATPFVRNVAASLDKLMLNTDKRFSKVG